MAMDFEDAIAKVSTIADSAEVPISDLKNAIVDMSNQTGISASEIADNVYNAISAGQKTGDAVAFVGKATMLAKAGFAESGAALDILTTVMNAYGLEADQVDKVSNNLIMTQNLGKTTVAELSAAMGKVIPTAKSTGVNLDELCASYAVMTSNGIATAETTTYLNSMLNELGKQGTTSADAFAKGTEHIKEGGLTMKEAMDMGWGLTDILSILDEQAVASGTSIGNMFGSAEAGKAATVLWDNAWKVNDAVAQMEESAGATEEAFGKLDTTSFNMQKTINEVKNSGIELGTTLMSMLAPMISNVSAKIHSACEWFNGLSESQQQTIIKIGAVVAAISPLLIVGGKLISGIGSIISIGGQLMGIVAGFNPVILAVVAGIGAVVAAIVYLWNTSETFRNSVLELLTYLKGIFDSFVADLLTIWEENLKPCFDAIGAFLQDVLAPIFERIFTGFIVPIIQDTVNQISDIWNNILKPIFTGIIDFITGVFSGNWEKAFSGIVSIAKGLLNGIVKIFEAPFEKAKKIVNNSLNFIKSLFNFDWKLPQLKLPHFRIQGSFSLNPPSVPTFGIDWYKKAMDDPMIMNSPTAFGINKLGQIMAGGEAGSEVVSGTDTLMNMIQEAVAKENSGVAEKIERLINFLFAILPQMLENMGNDIVLDDGVLVGRMAPAMDIELGRIASRKERL